MSVNRRESIEVEALGTVATVGHQIGLKETGRVQAGARALVSRTHPAKLNLDLS